MFKIRGDLEYKTLESVGADLVSQQLYCLHPGEMAIIGTGVFIEDTLDYCSDYELQVRPRSSLSAKGLVAHFGTIDPDYRDEIKVIMHNLSEKTHIIGTGDRIAQLVCSPIVRLPGVKIKQDKREGGFGSTGS